MKQKQKVRFMLGVLIFLVLVAGMKMTARAEKSGDYEYYVIEYGNEHGNVEVSRYTGSAKTVTIPKKIKGKKVTVVDRLESFSDSVQNVIIPEGVTFMGAYDYGAPMCYNYIKTVTIPKSVKTIEEGYFNYSPNLSYIKYNGTKKQWKSIDMGKSNPMAIEVRCKDGVLNKNKKYKDYTYAIQKNNTIIIRKYIGKSKDVTIPAKIAGKKVTTIDYGAFMCCNTVKSIKIPNGVSLIGFCAFDCKNLTKLTIPASVKKIILNGYMFSDSDSSLKYIKYGGTRKQWKALKTKTDDVISLEVKCKDKTINEHKQTKDYQYVILKNNEIKILKYLGNAESVKIPSKIGKNSVKIIGSEVFKNCSKLKTLTIPTSIYSIEYDAAYNCKKLFTINYSGTDKQWNKINVNMDSEWLIPVEIHCKGGKIVNEVTRNEDFIYRGNTILKYIGKSTKVQIPEEIIRKFGDGGEEDQPISKIASYAFKNCTKVTSVVIPKTIDEIGSDVFKNCEKLPYVTYAGTKKQWENVNGSIDNKEVVCKNGIIVGKIDYAYLKSVKSGKKSFTATWEKVDGALGYQIRYTTDEYLKKNIKIKTVKNVTSTTISKLKSGQNYYVQIRAYRKVYKTKKTIYSDWYGYDTSYESVKVK